MADTYTTVAGDTWDYISYKVYGSEKYTSYLMQNNLLKMRTFVFGAGVVLNTPAISEKEEVETNLPDWRR